MNYKELTDKIKAALHETPSESKTHSYAPAARMPQQRPSQIAPVKQVTRKTAIVSKEWNTEVKHTSNCSSQLELNSLPGADLIPDRVHRWKIKNHSAILRKMKAHIKSTEITSKVSVITSSQETQNAHEEKKQDELWRDMIKTQEERQFQITRITNFFS